MIHKFITFGQNPELRNEPVSTEQTFVPEVEICSDIETIWKIQELILEIRYAKSSGVSAKKQYKKLILLALPVAIHERERNWLRSKM
jgi:hypothetical protein